MRTVLILFLFLAFPLEAHHGPHHGQGDKNARDAQRVKGVYAKINASYSQNVKAIIDAKCGDCHGGPPRLPWYYSIPGIKGLIDRDIHEAQVHLIFSNGFPFGGHGTPTEDLEELKSALEKDNMPPTRYRVLHPGSSPTDNEKNAILSWIEESQKEMGFIREEEGK